MSTTLRTAKLIDLCTPSISYDAQVKSASAAFDNQCYEIIDDMNGVGVTDPVGDQPSMPKQGIIFIPSIMDIYDSNLIDILAWQFHVDFYDPTRDLEFRKNLVQKAITWHMRKGTVDLVQEVLDTYWPGGATITEWFEYISPLPPNAPNPNPGFQLDLPWHDRYRFRIYIDENIIIPADEQKVWDLIDRYKPITRWPEGLFRATVSDGQIGTTGVILRFVYHMSDEPDEHMEAESYHLQGPASGPAAVSSDHFTVTLPTLTTVSDVVIVTPNDGGAGGTFTPASVVLNATLLRRKAETPSATFTYTPPA
jgi:P2-related tail formation protein